ARWSPVERTRFKAVPANSACRVTGFRAGRSVRNLCRAELFPRRSPRDDLLALRVPTDPALTVGLSYRRNQMAEQPSQLLEFPGKYIFGGGGDPPRAKGGLFYRSPACGRGVDCRDFSKVFAHEGPPPHPAEDWRQKNLIAR